MSSSTGSSTATAASSGYWLAGGSGFTRHTSATAPTPSRSPLADVEDAADSISRLFAAIHYHGLFNAEFKLDERSGGTHRSR
jgi:hypothetical protein